MQIIEERTSESLALSFSGRIDVNASKQLEEEIASWAIPRFTQKLILDFSGVEYISSAGIRVLLSAQKKMKEDHKMIIRNPSPFCKQIFEITGADIFLKIEGSAN